MRTSLQKMLTSMSVLSVLAVLEPITGNPKWSVFLTFLCFLVFTKVTSDERLKNNMNRAARNGFIASILAMTALVMLLAAGTSFDGIILAIQLCLGGMMLTFAVSYTIYDRRGI